MRRRIKSRGSTVIEVLMAISVLAVGASGIIALQKVTTVANRNAKNLEIANEIARTWVERLQSDAMVWNHPSALDPNSDIGDTRWLLNNVDDPGTEQWFRPVDGTANIYGVHYATGNDDPSGSLNGPFCVNLRLTWLRPEQDLVRAEVRVYWLRGGIQPHVADLPDVEDPLCGSTPSPAPGVGGQIELYHFVHVTTALRKNQPL